MYTYTHTHIYMYTHKGTHLSYFCHSLVITRNTVPPISLDCNNGCNTRNTAAAVYVSTARLGMLYSTRTCTSGAVSNDKLSSIRGSRDKE